MLRKSDATSKLIIQDVVRPCSTKTIQVQLNVKKQCRICLQQGRIPILRKNNVDLLEAIRIFGNIDVGHGDAYPKYLCHTCYTLLQAAIQFRSIAQKSDQILRGILITEDSVKDLSINSYDNDTVSVDNSIETDDISNEETVAIENNPEPQPYNANQLIKIENKQDTHCKLSMPEDITNHYATTKILLPEGTKERKNYKVKCKVCSKEITKYYYKDHLALHGFGTKKPKEKAECKICKKSLEKAYYKQHMSVVHGAEHSKYVCYVCGKIFRFQSGYKSHILSHEDDFPFKCQLCPYRGRHAGLLKTHMRTHTRDYKYQCAECPSSFLTSGNLNKHMLKHKEREFKCNSCSRAFHSQSELDKHYQVDHLGIKKHVCNLCEKAFGYRSAMMKHQLHVHKREKLLLKGRIPSYLEAEHKKKLSQSN